MMELWPFTNFHDLNLDWIIKTIKVYTKKVEDFIEYIDKEIDDFHEAFTHYVNVTEGALSSGAIADEAVTLPKLAPEIQSAVTVVEYNINDYPGNTLNAKWDAMRASFMSWDTKMIVIPAPDASDPAAITVGNDIKWKIDAPLVFDNNCNCSEIYLYGELYPVQNISQAILIRDAITKPDNINFMTDIYIRGDRFNAGTIGNAIEVDSGARITFTGNIYINDCTNGIVAGGTYQTRPVSVCCGDIYVSFFDNSAVHIEGGTHLTRFTARNIHAQIAQYANKNAVEILEHVSLVNIDTVIYDTDVPKDGYNAVDAQAVVYIYTHNYAARNISIGLVYGTEAAYGVYIGSDVVSKLYNIMFDMVGIANTSAVGIYARYAYYMTINTVLNQNSIDVLNCFHSKINTYTGTVTNADRYCAINKVGIDSTTSILNVPPVTNLQTGDITMVKNANGTKIYMYDGNANIPFDGQMFIPAVTTLPTADWKTRGKMYRINNDSGTDQIAVCIRMNGSTYEWYDLIGGAII